MNFDHCSRTCTESSSFISHKEATLAFVITALSSEVDKIMSKSGSRTNSTHKTYLDHSVVFLTGKTSLNIVDSFVQGLGRAYEGTKVRLLQVHGSYFGQMPLLPP